MKESASATSSRVRFRLYRQKSSGPRNSTSCRLAAKKRRRRAAPSAGERPENRPTRKKADWCVSPPFFRRLPTPDQRHFELPTNYVATSNRPAEIKKGRTHMCGPFSAGEKIIRSPRR